MAYRLSVPFSITSPRFDEHFPEFLRRCQTAGVQRVILCVSMPTAPEAARNLSLKRLTQAVRQLHAAGMEAASWCSALGHGGPCPSDTAHTDVTAAIGRMRTLDGETDDSRFCPLDETLQALFADWVKQLAATGVDIIQIDDDYRMGYHFGKRFCCCDKHIALMEAETGEPFDAARM